MTQAEFYAAQKAAIDTYQEILAGLQTDLHQVYLDAADQVVEKLKQLDITGKGESATAEAMRQLEKLLRDTGKSIAGKTEDIISDTIQDLPNISNDDHLAYIKDAIKLSGTDAIDFKIIDKMYGQLNRTLIDLTYSRLQQDGYYFSDRIWGFPGSETQPYLPGLADDYLASIKSIINTGFAQGRDVFQIAKDLQVYLKDGKIELMKRYGELIRGSGEFARRIPKNIDWRAIRLARSEMYISLRETAIMQGKLNPAVRNNERVYKWNLTSGVVHCEKCIRDYNGSPYTERELPPFEHPNCLCYITLELIPRDQFVQDITDWGNGQGVPYLDAWYQNVYVPYL